MHHYRRGGIIFFNYSVTCAGQLQITLNSIMFRLLWLRALLKHLSLIKSLPPVQMPKRDLTSGLFLNLSNPRPNSMLLTLDSPFIQPHFANAWHSVIEIGPNSSDIAFAGMSYNIALTRIYVLTLFIGYISIARPSKSQSSSAVPSASASASGHHPSASHSAAGNKHKPTATLPSSIAPKPTSKPKPSHSEESVKPKPTASASKKDDDKPKHDDKPKKEDDKPKKEDDNKKNDDKEHAKEEPRYICHAYPDENGEMTTKCGPAPSGISKPSKRGTLLRRLLLNKF